MIFKIGLKACLLGLLACPICLGDDTDVDDGNPPPVAHALPENADRLFMKSGSELTGKISKEFTSEEDGRVYLLFESDSGGLMKIDKSRMVRKVQWAKDKAKFYQNLKIAGDDPNVLWKLHAWCKEESKTVYKDEMRYLLQRIVELDEHDEPGRRGLGFQLVDGQWVRKSQLWSSIGYVRNGTSWAPAIQADLESRQEEARIAQGERKKLFSLWLKDSRRPDAQRNQMTNRLMSFCDEIAVPIIMDKEAKDEEDETMLLIYIEAFGKVASYRANEALCYFAVQGIFPSVRERALDLLRQPHYDRAVSTGIIAKAGYLRAKNNAIVVRAAFAVGQLESPVGILPLIGALRTEHTVIPAGDPGRMNIRRDSRDGGVGMQQGSSQKAVKRIFQNASSLAGLKAITEQDFGYNAELWTNWYLKSHTLHNLDVRSDE